MFGLGVTELSIVLVIALVIFGGKKLRNLGGDLGGAISAFKDEVSPESEDDTEKDPPKETPPSEPETSDPPAASSGDPAKDAS